MGSGLSPPGAALGQVTLDELAAIVGESTQELGRWQRLGLLDDGDALDAANLERARLIAFAARRGIGPDRLADISAEQGDLLAPFVRWAQAAEAKATLTPTEVAEQAGIDADLLNRLWSIVLPDQTHADDTDVAAMRLATSALAMGLPTEALLQIARVLTDASAKAAETMNRLFHLYVHEQFRAEGLRGAELMAATESVADPMADLVEPAVLYFHRKSWERANREDLLLHLVEDATPPANIPGELVRTVLFVDLASFTPLTEAMGDEAATRIVERFGELVRQTLSGSDGHIVKQIGDEFMVVFATAAGAVAFGVDLLAAAADEPRFPALRLGSHVGSVLYREGDYLGANVNLAARVTSTAGRNQFLVTGSVRYEASDAIDLVPVGAYSLKGVREPVELFEVRSPRLTASKRADPVCGMELDEPSANANLMWHGRQLLFCSEECLRRFLEQPERYTPS